MAFNLQKNQWTTTDYHDCDKQIKTYNLTSVLWIFWR